MAVTWLPQDYFRDKICRSLGAAMADVFCRELEREREKRVVVQFLIIWLALLEG